LTRLCEVASRASRRDFGGAPEVGVVATSRERGEGCPGAWRLAGACDHGDRAAANRVCWWRPATVRANSAH